MKETNKLLFIYITILPMSVIWSSCSVAKKNEKAVNRVLADVNLVKEVRTKTDPLFPCINDSIFTTKTDTLTTYDTAIITKDNHDTIIHVKDCPVKVITKTVRIKDTVTVVTKDGREEKRLQDDLDLAVKRMIAAQQETIKAQGEADKYRQDKNMWMWIAIGLMVAAGIGVVLKLKKVF